MNTASTDVERPSFVLMIILYISTSMKYGRKCTGMKKISTMQSKLCKNVQIAN